MRKKAAPCKECHKVFEPSKLSHKGYCYECGKKRMLWMYDAMWGVKTEQEAENDREIHQGVLPVGESTRLPTPRANGFTAEFGASEKLIPIASPVCQGNEGGRV